MKVLGSEGPFRILYVEDSAADTALVREYLEYSNLGNVQIECIHCIERVLNGEVDVDWDLVLLDCLVGETGAKLLRCIRERGVNCPAIILTNYGDPKDFSELVRLGIEDFILKDSLRPETLQASINQSLKKRRFELERNHLEEKTRQLERLACLGETIAMAGHSIKNILTAIRGSMAVMNDILSESEDKHLPAHWGIIHRSLNQLNTFVLEMLDFAKSEEIRLVNADLNAICRETLRDCAILARESGVRLQEELDLLLTPFQFDPERMKDTLLNLVKNAIEACSEVNGGCVTLSTDLSPESEEALVTVLDNGPGICETVRNNLFKPFTSTKGPRGTGLGLAIAERNILAHEGKVTLESNGQGGAEFRIRLPIRARKKSPSRLAVAAL